MKYLTKEVRIGLAGIVALCILVYGINYLKGIHMFKPTNYFYVKFHNINGLTKSSPVFADGFRVGIVRDLYYDYTEPGKVIAEIDVDPELRIPKGSTAELASELMGGVKMNLLLANNPREKYLTGDTLQGNVNNGVMDQVATIMPQVEKMLPKLDSILASLNTILGDPAIPGTLHSVQNTMANMGTDRRFSPRHYRHQFYGNRIVLCVKGCRCCCPLWYARCKRCDTDYNQTRHKQRTKSESRL